MPGMLQPRDAGFLSCCRDTCSMSATNNNTVRLYTSRTETKLRSQLSASEMPSSWLLALLSLSACPSHAASPSPRGRASSGCSGRRSTASRRRRYRGSYSTPSPPHTCRRCGGRERRHRSSAARQWPTCARWVVWRHGPRWSGSSTTCYRSRRAMGSAVRQQACARGSPVAPWLGFGLRLGLGLGLGLTLPVPVPLPLTLSLSLSLNLTCAWRPTRRTGRACCRSWASRRARAAS